PRLQGGGEGASDSVIANLLVVKIGGGEGLDLERCVGDLAALAAERPLIVVHGVSAAMNALCAARSIPVRTITSPTGHSSRYTDAPTRDAFVEAADGVNADLVARLQRLGIRATGMTGESAVLRGERKSAIRAVVDGRVRMIRDDYSGSINGVDARLLLDALNAGYVPVVPPYAASDAGLLNVDGDRASAAIAGALGAAELVILSNVRGLYRSFPDEDSFVQRVERREIERALDWAQGRMKRKVLGAQEALESGVRRVIADRRATAGHRSAERAGTEFVA
ncbi:MAG: [LysW]-aminoadipate kinase, partial [Anaerolineae bacterium]|nr:[LysW]-aminoadipate kinase [Anaerolineae bacterium]